MRKKEKHLKEKKHKFLSFLFPIISLIIILICAKYIYTWINENHENQELLEEIYEETISVDENTGEEYTDFNKLKEKNKDVVGWIKVNNTNIDYPVVKGNDNSYYIKHNFENKYNIAGWIFADYNLKFDGNDKNIVIYGHNMKNGSMFGSLKNTLNKEWYENSENLTIKFETENSIFKYKVFSIYQIKKELYYTTTSFQTNEQYKNFINTIKSRSIKNFEENVTIEDKILTLSTCAGNNNYRVVLHSYLIEEINKKEEKENKK